MTGVLLYRRRLGHRDAGKEDQVKTQGEDSHLRAKERGLRRSQSCRHLDLRILSSRIVKKMNFCYLSYPVCGTLLWQLKQMNRVSDLLHQHSFKEENLSSGRSISGLPFFLPTRKPFYCCLTNLEGRREAQVRSLVAERRHHLYLHMPHCTV